MIVLPKNKIAVDPLYDPDVTPGGIIIPDMAKERSDQGIVKYVGSAVQDIEIGDYVLFSGYTGTTLRLEGEGILIILPEEFVVCKLLPPDTDIPGLYFRGADGDYFGATYEQTIHLVALAFQDANIRKRFGIKDRKSPNAKPAVEEINWR